MRGNSTLFKNRIQNYSEDAPPHTQTKPNLSHLDEFQVARSSKWHYDYQCLPWGSTGSETSQVTVIDEDEPKPTR